MRYILNEINETLKNTITDKLSEIGIKNFTIETFSGGATYPTPACMNFKILKNNTDKSNYISIKTRLDTNDLSDIKISVSAHQTENRIIHYINGGSHSTTSDLKTYIDTKVFPIGKVSNMVDVEKYGAEWHTFGGGYDNVEKAEKNYPNKLVGIYKTNSGYTDYFDDENSEADAIIENVKSVIIDFINEGKDIFTKNYSEDTIYNHLNEFESLSQDEWVEIKNNETQIYFRKGQASKFYSLTQKELDDIKYDVPFGTLRGTRKYLKFGDATYVWFGEDTVCSLDC